MYVEVIREEIQDVKVKAQLVLDTLTDKFPSYYKDSYWQTFQYEVDEFLIMFVDKLLPKCIMSAVGTSFVLGPNDFNHSGVHYNSTGDRMYSASEDGELFKYKLPKLLYHHKEIVLVSFLTSFERCVVLPSNPFEKEIKLAKHFSEVNVDILPRTSQIMVSREEYKDMWNLLNIDLDDEKYQNLVDRSVLNGIVKNRQKELKNILNSEQP